MCAVIVLMGRVCAYIALLLCSQCFAPLLSSQCSPAPHNALTLSALLLSPLCSAPQAGMCLKGDPEGMLPCDDGKYYIPRPSNETEKTDKYFDEILGNKAQDEL